MKTIQNIVLGFITVIIVAGCDSSPKTEAQKHRSTEAQKREIAQFACAEIKETRNFESARRVKLVNDARKEIGKGPYTFGDALIKLKVFNGDCESLIY